jgi:hypothetical protein
VIIGAQRCGTTWTYSQLAAHPSVRPAWRKEVHFFDQPRNFARGLSWYRAHFPRVGPGRLTGEATPRYLYAPAAARRLVSVLPDARLIALLRNPVDRAYSHYQFAVKYGRERRSFGAALDGQLDGGDTAGLQSGGPYLARGRYAEQLARVFSLVSRGQVLVVRSEDLWERPVEGFGELFRFLGLSPTSINGRPDDTGRYNPMPEALRARLVEYFRPHNERLYALLGRDLGWDR